MGCGLITIIASLLGIPLIFGAGAFLGAQTVASTVTPIVATPSATDEAAVPVLRLVYVPDPTAEYTGDDLAAAVTVLTERLDVLGIDGEVMLQDDDEIVVLLPPVDDLDTLMTELVRPGVFELVEMHELGDAALSLVDQTIDTENYPDRGGQRNARTGEPFAVIVSNEHVEQAVVTFDDSMGRSLVTIFFNQEGAALLEAYTAAHIGVPLGIVVDGVVLLAPVIQDAVSDEAVINITEDDAAARRLAAQVGGSVLPVSLILGSIEAIRE